ncbi:MAG: glycosylase [Firmicutes bacterium]|nr:glycosylase [Bacillota bacterium]
MAASWLKNAVFYEIYPQSFYDANGDGIGDFAGISEKLPYVRSLGCNAIWLNPCFDSPFRDAGYDVRNYKLAAPRYGTNEELKALFDKAHSLGIRVLLDLVPGHTSEEHPWFVSSGSEEPTEYDDRYIWTNHAFARGDGMPFIGGDQPRWGTYIINFFKCQPALNYGYYNIHEPWQQSIDAPGPLATREAMKDVMRFWLRLGCDGFRVDMADSLVKNDPGDRPGTCAVWRDLLGTMHAEFPEAAFVSEWNNPELALNCGFDMDFYLNWGGNGYAVMMRNYDEPAFGQTPQRNESYFSKDAHTSAVAMLKDYLPKYTRTKDAGLWCWISGNHDTTRLAPLLDERERRLAFAFLFTMPGAPFLYYGDEIGMSYLPRRTKEGGYQRTGSRTPMQWTNGRNLGFSEAEGEKLYLPVDSAPDAPNVAEQEADPDSFLNFTRSLIALRGAWEELGNYAPFAVYRAEEGSRLFAYKRGSLLVAMNPSGESLSLPLDGAYSPLFTIGDTSLAGKSLILGAQSFALLRPEA